MSFEAKTNQKGTVGIGIPGAKLTSNGTGKKCEFNLDHWEEFFEHDLATALGSEDEGWQMMQTALQYQNQLTELA